MCNGHAPFLTGFTASLNHYSSVMELDSYLVVNVPQMIKVILRAVNIHRNMVEIAFEWF